MTASLAARFAVRFVARFVAKRDLIAALFFGLVVFGGRLDPSAWSAPPDNAANGAAGGYTGAAMANAVTEFKGTLKGAQGNVMTVTREDGTECLVQFPDEITSLNFTATALPAYLRRGMPVRFATVLGPTGMPMTPVEKIEIFSPLPASAVPHNQSSRFTPGVQSSDRKKPQRGAPLTGKVDVVGNLMMYSSQGAITIQAGATPVQMMVSPTAKLEIRLHNLTLAQPGDPVTVAGFYQPPDETKVKANRITITTDRVYGEEPPPTVRTRGAKRGKAKDAEKDATVDAADMDPEPEQ